MKAAIAALAIIVLALFIAYNIAYKDTHKEPKSFVATEIENLQKQQDFMLLSGEEKIALVSNYAKTKGIHFKLEHVEANQAHIDPQIGIPYSAWVFKAATGGNPNAYDDDSTSRWIVQRTLKEDALYRGYLAIQGEPMWHPGADAEAKKAQEKEKLRDLPEGNITGGQDFKTWKCADGQGHFWDPDKEGVCHADGRQ